MWQTVFKDYKYTCWCCTELYTCSVPLLAVNRICPTCRRGLIEAYGKLDDKTLKEEYLKMVQYRREVDILEETKASPNVGREETKQEE